MIHTPDNTPSHPGKTPSLLSHLLPGASLLLLITLVAYTPALAYAGFVWDDDILQKLSALQFWTPYNLFQIWARPGFLSKFEDHYWPMIYTGFWMEYQLFGLRPFFWHLTNTLLHCANVLLIWRIAIRMHVPGAWLAAALFALHPVHVESVSWVIELKDVLSACFYLLAFHCYLLFDASEQNQKRTCILSLLCFSAGMLSKSIVVTLPAAILIFHYWRDGRITLRHAARLIPYVIIAAAILGIDYLCIRAASHTTPPFTLFERVMLPLRAFWFYVQHLLAPMKLVPIYPKWNLSAVNWELYLCAAALPITLLVLGLLSRRIGRAPAAAFAFYLITLSPVLGIIPFSYMQHSYVADRYQYLASAAPLLLFGALLSRLVQAASPQTKVLGTTAVAAILAAMGFMAWSLAMIWSSNLTLFERNVHLHPNVYNARILLGYALANEAHKPQEAIPHFRHAASLEPNFPEVHFNLGYLLLDTGETTAAVHELDKALQLQPVYPTARLKRGEAMLKLGRKAEALDDFRTTLQTDPTNDQARRRIIQLSIQ